MLCLELDLWSKNWLLKKCNYFKHAISGGWYTNVPEILGSCNHHKLNFRAFQKYINYWFQGELVRPKTKKVTTVWSWEVICFFLSQCPPKVRHGRWERTVLFVERVCFKWYHSPTTYRDSRYLAEQEFVTAVRVRKNAFERAAGWSMLRRCRLWMFEAGRTALHQGTVPGWTPTTSIVGLWLETCIST